jgi:ABC-type oligopeptide transport system substrate-binding subunit
MFLLVNRDEITRPESEVSLIRHPTETFLNNSHPKTTPVWHPTNGPEAVRLFAEAGLHYENGALFKGKERFTVKLAMHHGATTEQRIRLVRKMIHRWENAGIAFDFKIIEDTEKTWAKEFDGLFVDILERKSIPATMEQLYKIDNEPSYFGIHLEDETLKELIRSLKNEQSKDFLREKKMAIQERIKETCPLIPLYYEAGHGMLGWAYNFDADVKKEIAKDPALLSYLIRMK